MSAKDLAIKISKEIYDGQIIDEVVSVIERNINALVSTLESENAELRKQNELYNKNYIALSRQIEVLRSGLRYIQKYLLGEGGIPKETSKNVNGILSRKIDSMLEEALKGAPQRVKYADESHLKPKPSEEKP